MMYNHNFLTVPIILYMVWGKRAQLASGQVSYSMPGFVLLLLSSVFYLFGLLTQVHTVILLSMILTIIGTLVFILGVQCIKQLFIPLVLLLMLIPVPEQLYIQLTFPLQISVSEASEALVRLFGVSIFREGNIMTIPTKSFEVVEACSGLRSMITLLTLSVIVGYFMLRSAVCRLVLIAASVPIAIMVNVLRVVTMILLFHFFEIDLTEGGWHTGAGVMVFVVAMLLLLLLQRVMEFWELKKR